MIMYEWHHIYLNRGYNEQKGNIIPVMNSILKLPKLSVSLKRIKPPFDNVHIPSAYPGMFQETSFYRRCLLTTLNVFCVGYEYARKREVSKGYWNPKVKKKSVAYLGAFYWSLIISLLSVSVPQSHKMRKNTFVLGSTVHKLLATVTDQSFTATDPSTDVTSLFQRLGDS